MERVAKTYRFPAEFTEHINELTRILGVSETEAIFRAIKFYIAFIKNEDEAIKQRSVVSLKEYEALQHQLSQVLYRLGVLEGENTQKDKQIQEQKELINKLIESQKESTKKWWRFWR